MCASPAEGCVDIVLTVRLLNRGNQLKGPAMCCRHEITVRTSDVWSSIIVNIMFILKSGTFVSSRYYHTPHCY